LFYLNDSYNCSLARVRALRRYSLIWIFDFENEGIISSPCIFNGRQGRLLFERPVRDSQQQAGTVSTVPDSKLLLPMTILGEKIP
jgi:hypothetical protein